MTQLDVRNLLIAIIGYLILAPAGGVLAGASRRAQEVLFFGIVFLQCIKSTTYGIMMFSVEWYRGHTKGCEFTLVDMMCIALLVALFISKPGKFKFCPPGLLLYLFFVGAATFSIIGTFKPYFTLMATFNFLKATLLYLTAFNFIRSRRDFRIILWAMAGALLLECLLVLKQKYVDGFFQPYGFYDHQNSMCMWVYFYAVPLFAAALSKQTKPGEAWLFIAATGAGALTIVAALSRGALASIILCCGLVMLGSIIFGGFTRRKVAIIVIALFAGTAVLYKASDSIIERFANAGDVGGEEKDFREFLNEVSKKMLVDTTTGVGWNNFNVANSRPYPVYSRMYEAYFANIGHSIVLKKFRNNANTESLYWMYLAETGYLGFGAMILFMGVTLFWLIRAFWQRKKELKDTTVGFFLGGMVIVMCAIYAHSTIERVLTQTNNLLSWLLFLGIGAYFEQERRNRLKPEKHARWHLYFRLFRKFILKEKDPIAVSSNITSHG